MDQVLLLLCMVAFAAGFVDAIVGGGGLIQTPMALLLLPGYGVSVVIGTLKIPAFCGTGVAAVQYARQAMPDKRLLLLAVLPAFVAAFMGSWLQTLVPNDFLKPMLVVILSLLAVYTYTKKDFGLRSSARPGSEKMRWYVLGTGIIMGLYDGFIGPGAGIFLVLSFTMLMGYDMLHASAGAKLVNLATNFGSVCLFLLKGKILWGIALPMALCNAAGGWAGARLAVRKGNRFIRSFFMVVVCVTLLRLLYDVFLK